MLLTLTEVKSYLRVDDNDDDILINGWISMSEDIVKDILRSDTLADTELNKTAMLYAMAYLYEHRENADMAELTGNLRVFLSTKREVSF